MGRYANTKLGKTYFLNRYPDIRKHMPETKHASTEHLRDMLARHHMVYVKPNLGTGGFGIVKAEIVRQGTKRWYQYKFNASQRRFSTFQAFYGSLCKIMNRRTYLVQRGIHMLHYRNRPFDIRIMVQKNERGAWEHTGTIGRLAQPRRVVTNYHNGGTPLPLGTLLKPHLSSGKIKSMHGKLASLALKVASHMQHGFPKVKELGVDVGLDQAQYPWIFEVNTRPDPFIFLRLGKPAVFRRIIRLTRMHGRFRRKR